MKPLVLALIFGCFNFLTCLASEVEVMVEGGGVWQYRNDLQIPPTTQGSRVALDQVDSGPFSFYRLEGYWRFAKNHGARVVYAPFKITLNNRPTNDIEFNGQSFSAGEETEYTYQFNSYRLTYFYAFWGHGDDQLNVGFTAKIRDADTIISQAGQKQNYDNVGFVPLLYIEYQKKLGGDWLFHTSFDGLAGGPGRAFDWSFKLRRKISKLATVGLGTRFLEGGADNDKVFSFSLFHYALADIIFHF